MQKNYQMGGVLILMALAIIFTGCSTNQLNVAAKSIITAQEIYDATMSAAGDAYKVGKIEDDAKDKIVAMGTLAYESINMAQISLLACLDVSTAENERRLQVALTAMRENLVKLIDSAVSFGIIISSTVANYKEGGNGE